MPRDNAVIYRSYWEATRSLEKEVRLEIWDAIAAFSFEKTEPTFIFPTSKLIWTLIRPTLSSSYQAWELGNKGASKRWGKENPQAPLLFSPDTPPLYPPTENSDSYRIGMDRIGVQIEKFKKENPSKYPDLMYQEFVRYWIEPFIKGVNKGKERWEGEKTWSLSGRLATWFGNSKGKYESTDSNERPQPPMKD